MPLFTIYLDFSYRYAKEKFRNSSSVGILQGQRNRLQARKESVEILLRDGGSDLVLYVDERVRRLWRVPLLMKSGGTVSLRRRLPEAIGGDVSKRGAAGT
jgi:hypothetical protein